MRGSRHICSRLRDGKLCEHLDKAYLKKTGKYRCKIPSEERHTNWNRPTEYELAQAKLEEDEEEDETEF